MCAPGYEPVVAGQTKGLDIKCKGKSNHTLRMIHVKSRCEENIFVLVLDS